MGKKSRKGSCSKNLSNSDRKNPAYLKSVIDYVSHCLKLADEEKLPLEHYFSHHRHSVSSCDGDGAFNLISLFVLNPSMTVPGTPERSVITTICMRVHDNVRNTMILPNDALQNGSMRELMPGIGLGKTMDEYYDAFVEQICYNTGCGFRKAPYAYCKTIVNDCLLRMKSKKKVLVGKEERTVVRLFGLESENSFHQQQIHLPRPAPAPDVATLWLLLNRPEHYFFTVNSDLYELFGFEVNDVVINQDYFEKSLNYILEDEYRQERLPAMLNHAAHWHMLEGSEEDVASWLLWERQPMILNPIGRTETIDAMKKSLVLQLMINKYFDGQTGNLLMCKFPSMKHYGEGITNYLFYTRHLSMTGRLPPAFIITASVAEGIDTASGSNGGNASADSVDRDASTDLERTMRKLTIKKSSCAVCGATRTPNGSRLLVCSRCESVAYCCAEHQKIHWKSGGHKQECTLE